MEIINGERNCLSNYSDEDGDFDYCSVKFGGVKLWILIKASTAFLRTVIGQMLETVIDST